MVSHARDPAGPVGQLVHRFVHIEEHGTTKDTARGPGVNKGVSFDTVHCHCHEPAVNWGHPAGDQCVVRHRRSGESTQAL